MSPSTVVALLSLCLVACAAYPLGYEGYNFEGQGEFEGAAHEKSEHEPTSYSYKYGVHDGHTGDFKSASEQRHGDFVSGQYQLLQPDGLTRIVKYTADKHNGFNAEVLYSKH